MPPDSGARAADADGAASAGEALAPLAEVWNARDAAANLRRFGIADPAIPLLENLGRAARACPLLERGLECAGPEEVRISAAEAYEFLHEGQEALAGEGFEVRIPPTLASRRGRKPTLRLTVRPDPGSPVRSRVPYGRPNWADPLRTAASASTRW